MFLRYAGNTFQLLASCIMPYRSKSSGEFGAQAARSRTASAHNPAKTDLGCWAFSFQKSAILQAYGTPANSISALIQGLGPNVDMNSGYLYMHIYIYTYIQNHTNKWSLRSSINEPIQTIPLFRHRTSAILHMSNILRLFTPDGDCQTLTNESTDHKTLG